MSFRPKRLIENIETSVYIWMEVSATHFLDILPGSQCSDTVTTIELQTHPMDAVHKIARSSILYLTLTLSIRLVNC